MPVDMVGIGPDFIELKISLPNRQTNANPNLTGYIDVVMLLVESGADPTASSKDDKIPLSCAAKAGHYAVMSYLLSKEHDSHTLMEERDVFEFSFFVLYLVQ